MTEKEWQEFRFSVEVEEQELAFYYKDEQWWISRLYGEDKSYLLTPHSKNSYTQEFRTAAELFTNGIVDGKPFIERVKDFF